MAVEDIVVAFTGINIALYLGLLYLAFRAARMALNPRLRLISWAAAAVAGVFVIGALQRLLIQDSRLSFVSSGTRATALLWGQYVLSLVALGALGLVEAARRRSIGDLRRIRQVILATSELEAARMSARDINASKRELDVLAAIHSGCLTDREIAEKLYISPATAGSHVRSLLKKAGLRRRRSLLLVELDADAGGAP